MSKPLIITAQATAAANGLGITFRGRPSRALRAARRRSNRLAAGMREEITTPPIAQSIPKVGSSIPIPDVVVSPVRRSDPPALTDVESPKSEHGACSRTGRYVCAAWPPVLIQPECPSAGSIAPATVLLPSRRRSPHTHIPEEPSEAAKAAARVVAHQFNSATASESEAG
jgi:hypothetical protein